MWLHVVGGAGMHLCDGPLDAVECADMHVNKAVHVRAGANSAYFWLSAAILSSSRAVVLLLPAASSVAGVTSCAPPSEGAAAPATAARFEGGSGAFMSCTASYSSRICKVAQSHCCFNVLAWNFCICTPLDHRLMARGGQAYLAPQLGFLTAQSRRSSFST